MRFEGDDSGAFDLLGYRTGGLRFDKLSPQGKQLGTLRFSEQPANLAWGDADRQTLYVTARTGLYRVRLSVAGAGIATGASP